MHKLEESQRPGRSEEGVDVSVSEKGRLSRVREQSGSLSSGRSGHEWSLRKILFHMR